MKIIRHAAFLAAAAVLSSSAMAADGGYTQEEIASQFDIAFGAAVTSRYISRGVDYSDGVALQGYVEPSYGMVYGGVWFSTLGHDTNAGPDEDVEINLYAGIRPEFGDLSLDLGYARYYYDDAGDLGGEFYAKATYAFTEQFSAGGEIYFDPDSDGVYGVANVEVSLPYDLTLSAAVGNWLNEGTSGNSEDNVDWNVGLSYTFAEVVTLDGRYYDSNFDHGRFVVTLSVDTSWSALRGN